MSAHHCHMPGCRVATPPRLLMCAKHWAAVEPATQREVYRTVRQRANAIDATWAPWWRAAHRAIAQAMLSEKRDPELVRKWLDREMNFANTLEAR